MFCGVLTFWVLNQKTILILVKSPIEFLCFFRFELKTLKKETLADNQCKFGCIYRVRVDHVIVQSANKISYDSLFNLKSYNLKSCNLKSYCKEPLYIFFHNMQEMFEFCNLWNYEDLLTKNFARLCTTLHTI